MRALELKMQQWMENGAELAWMIDPFASEVIVYRKGRSGETLHAPEVLIADAVVPGFSLDMKKFWAP